LLGFVELSGQQHGLGANHAQRACSLANLSAWCRERFGDHAVASQPQPRPFDLPWLVLDATRAREAWEWEPTTSVVEIFEEIADHE
jgi:CDP-paratose 2-epimerase